MRQALEEAIGHIADRGRPGERVLGIGSGIHQLFRHAVVPVGSIPVRIRRDRGERDVTRHSSGPGSSTAVNIVEYFYCSTPYPYPISAGLPANLALVGPGRGMDSCGCLPWWRSSWDDLECDQTCCRLVIVKIS